MDIVRSKTHWEVVHRWLVLGDRRLDEYLQMKYRIVAIVDSIISFAYSNAMLYGHLLKYTPYFFGDQIP